MCIEHSYSKAQKKPRSDFMKEFKISTDGPNKNCNNDKLPETSNRTVNANKNCCYHGCLNNSVANTLHKFPNVTSNLKGNKSINHWNLKR